MSFSKKLVKVDSDSRPNTPDHLSISIDDNDNSKALAYRTKDSEDKQASKSLLGDAADKKSAAAVIQGSPILPREGRRATHGSLLLNEERLGERRGTQTSLMLLQRHRLLQHSASGASNRSSFRQKFSEAGSFLSVYIARPSKLLKNSMMLAALSAFLMALYGMLYGIIKDDIARATVTVTRGFLQFAWNFLASCYLGKKFQLRKCDEVQSKVVTWTHFLLVAAFGGLRLCLIFAALQLTEMAIVHTILNGSPVMVMILAHFMLSGGERMTWIKIFSAFLLIIGVILNSNPIEAVQHAVEERNLETVMGIILAILGLIFSSLGSIYTKKVSKHFSKLHISSAIGFSITLFGLISVLFDGFFSSMRVMKMNHQFVEQHMDSSQNVSLAELLPVVDQLPLTDLSCLFSDEDHFHLTPESFSNLTMMHHHMTACEIESPPYFPANTNVWATTIVVGLLGIAQQYCLIAAIKMGSPSRVSMMRSSSIIFSFVLQSSHSMVPDWNQWVGAAIILGAIFVNILEASVKKKLEEFRQKWCQKSRGNSGEKEKPQKV